MSPQQVLFGVAEISTSVLISLVLIFVTYRLILSLTRRFDEENQLRRGNVAVGIVLGSVLLGQAIVVRQALFPITAVFQIFLIGEERTAGAVFRFLALSVGYLLLSGLLAVAGIFFCFWLFDRLTPRIHQYEEIKKGNIAVAVFMALLIIGVSLLLSAGVSGLTRALIPFPEVGTVRLD